MLKTRDYDLLSMRNEQYLTHTNYALWEVIVNGDAHALIASVSDGAEAVIPPKTTKQKIARMNELKAKSTLLLAILDEHLLKFHGIKDAKTLWEAIKTRFGGNKESNKMQKTILKQQYENFAPSRSEGEVTLIENARHQGSYQAEEGPTDFALMAFSSSVSSSSNTECKWSEEDNNQANDRYKAVEGYHAVPSPYTGNFMPLRPDLSFIGRNFVPTVVITNSGKVPVNTAKQSSSRAASSTSTARFINTAATRPIMNGAKPSLIDFYKSHSPVRRTFNQRTETKNSYLKEKITTAKDQEIFDSRCSRHMTRNKSFRIDYQEIDGGFVAFRGSLKGGKIYGKCKIRTGKLDFKDVYFVQELKFNLFSISQMRDKKNSVLFTETECHVLSPDFKLLDENQNKVLVTKPHNKTPYELLIGRLPNLNFMRHFGCLVTILNTLDHLGKFKGKANEGFSVGYSVNSKAFTVFNSRTRKVEENLHIRCLENKSNVVRRGSKWLFDVDSLTKSMNYETVTTGNQTNDDACIEINVNAGQAGQEKASDHEYILLPFMPSYSPLSSSTQSLDDKDVDKALGKGDERKEVGTEANINNLELSIVVSPIPTTRVYKDHLKEQIIGDLNLVTQTRRMLNFSEENAMIFLMARGPLEPNRYLEKKDEREIVVRNKARIVAQGYTQEEGIDYDEVFAHVARIEALRLSLDYALFIGFIVYQIDVKSAFLYSTIEEEVYVCQPPRFEDPYFSNMVYKVEKALYCFHQAPRACYAGASLDRKSTTGGCQFLGKRLIPWQCKKQTIVANFTTEAEQPFEPQPPSSTAPPEQVLAAVSQPQKTHTHKRTKRGQDTKIPHSSGPPQKVSDEDVYTGEDDRVVKAATTAASLEAEQESGGPKCHVTTLGDTDTQTRFETASKQSHDLPLSEVNTSRSREDSMKHQDDLTNFIPPTPYDSPLSGGHTPESNEVSTAGNVVNAASVIPDVSVASPSTSTAREFFKDEMTTITNTLMAIRSTRPRTTSVVIHNVEEEPRRATPLPTVQSQDKEEQPQFEKEQRIAREKAAEQEAKDATLIEQMEDKERGSLLHKELNKLETSHQLELNSETRCEQQAKSSKKISRADHDQESVKKQKLKEDDDEKKELKACLDLVLVDDIAINVESLATKYPIVDWKTHTLTETLQQEDREQFTIDEQVIMLVDLIAERKRFFVAQITEHIRNEPPTKAQLRNKMVTYLEHMGNYMKESKKSSKKRSRADPDQESIKKQKLEEDDAEKEELRACLDLVPVDDIAINVESLATKYLIDYNLISWRLFDSYGVHVLLMDTGIAIHMPVERKYPLIQEMLSRLLNKRIEIDHESEEVFGYILLVIKMLIMKKLDD
uniref:Uncharacterized protein n=1 Tax=Tanacetum cinerariifolium TaxID=118510 RepID=A0A6L2JRP4_TANCI|nr:hypothetical protein [Tanacetum cinerariifolium]